MAFASAEVVFIFCDWSERSRLSFVVGVAFVCHNDVVEQLQINFDAVHVSVEAVVFGVHDVHFGIKEIEIFFEFAQISYNVFG